MREDLTKKLGSKYEGFVREIMEMINLPNDERKLKNIRISLARKIGEEIRRKGSILHEPDMVKFCRVLRESRDWNDCKYRIKETFAQFSVNPIRAFKAYDYNWKIPFEIPESEFGKRKRTTVKEVRKELAKKNEEIYLLKKRIEDLEKEVEGKNVVKESEKLVGIEKVEDEELKVIRTETPCKKILITIEIT